MRKWIDICEAMTKANDPRSNPAFRAWFGDSKVVHKDGTPMVVYHGTSSNFDVFDPDKAQAEGNGFFFIRDAGIQQGRAAAKSAGGYASVGKLSGGGNVMPVYLRMVNPYVTGFTEELPDDATDAHVHDWMDRQSRFDKQFNDDSRKINYFENAISYAKHHGHDGVIFKEITDDRNHHDIFSMPSDVFVVFDPKQIKSAIGNRGTFNPDSKSITESEGGLVQVYRGVPANANEMNTTFGLFFSSSRHVAASYAGQSGKVIEVMLDTSRALHWTTEVAEHFQWYVINWRRQKKLPPGASKALTRYNRIWGAGMTMAEAIGALLREHPGRVGHHELDPLMGFVRAYTKQENCNMVIRPHEEGGGMKDGTKEYIVFSEQQNGPGAGDAGTVTERGWQNDHSVPQERLF